MVVIFLVSFINFAGTQIPPHFPGVKTDKAVDFAAAGPNLPAGCVVVAEFFLRPDLVLEGTPLMPVGNGRQGAGTQTFHFKGQTVARPVNLFHGSDLRHTMFRQPLIHVLDKLIGMGMFRPGICKQKQVNRDVVLIKPDKQGGTVRTASKRNNVDRPSSYYKVVVIRVPLQGQNATIDKVLWIGLNLLPQDGFGKAPTTALCF